MAEIAHRSLPELVYSDLLTEIVNGHRPAGSKLSEEEICGERSVSRTPVREALMLLHRDGLVERIPRRGCFVRTFDAAEIGELFECRRILECLALDMGFERIPAEDLRELGKGLASGGEQDPKVSLAIDDRLHALIVEACPNRHLRDMATQLIKRSYPFRFWRTYGAESVADISEERRRILRAILDGDKPTALRLLAEHIDRGRRLMERQAAGGMDR